VCHRGNQAAAAADCADREKRITEVMHHRR